MNSQQPSNPADVRLEARLALPHRSSPRTASSAVTRLGLVLKDSVLFFLRIYRMVGSAALHTLMGPGQGCRFEPSCSAYAEEAVGTFGFLKGTGLAIWRVLRCHPFSKGGWDPVPTPRQAHPHHGVESCCMFQTSRRWRESVGR